MVRITDQAQVLNAVVGLVSVDVMNVHAGWNRTVNGFPDDAMLERTSIRRDPDPYVSRAGHAPSTLPSAAACASRSLTGTVDTQSSSEGCGASLAATATQIRSFHPHILRHMGF